MKKCKIALWAALALLMFLVPGCQKDNTKTEPSLINGAEIKAESLSEKISNMTEVTSYVGDMDADGTDERIVLSTSAGRDAKGDFLWNDGQSWALYVVDGPNDAYLLFDEYVQAGNVYFDVADYYLKDGPKPKITLTVSTSAGLSIKNFAFEKEKSAYVEEVLFDTKDVTEAGINKRFSSIPEIIK